MSLPERNMLDVRRDGRAVIVTWEGTLDEPAVGAILAAMVGEDSFSVVLDLTRAFSIQDSALARLARSLRPEQFRGLREHQERRGGARQLSARRPDHRRGQIAGRREPRHHSGLLSKHCLRCKRWRHRRGRAMLWNYGWGLRRFRSCEFSRGCGEGASSSTDRGSRTRACRCGCRGPVP